MCWDGDDRGDDFHSRRYGERDGADAEYDEAHGQMEGGQPHETPASPWGGLEHHEMPALMRMRNVLELQQAPQQLGTQRQGRRRSEGARESRRGPQAGRGATRPTDGPPPRRPLRQVERGTGAQDSDEGRPR